MKNALLEEGEEEKQDDSNNLKVDDHRLSSINSEMQSQTTSQQPTTTTTTTATTITATDTDTDYQPRSEASSKLSPCDNKLIDFTDSMRDTGVINGDDSKREILTIDKGIHDRVHEQRDDIRVCYSDDSSEVSDEESSPILYKPSTK